MLHSVGADFTMHSLAGFKIVVVVQNGRYTKIVDEMGRKKEKQTLASTDNAEFFVLS